MEKQGSYTEISYAGRRSGPARSGGPRLPAKKTPVQAAAIREATERGILFCFLTCARRAKNIEG